MDNTDHLGQGRIASRQEKRPLVTEVGPGVAVRQEEISPSFEVCFGPKNRRCN